MNQLLTRHFNELFPIAVGFGLVIMRCSGMFIMIPTLGGEAIAARLRVAFAIVIGFTIASLFGPVTLSHPYQIILAALGELLMGLAMGLVLRMVLASSEMAGEVIGLSMGLTFMQIMDPLTRESSSIPSQIMGILITLILLATEGHHTILAGLVSSFQQAPIGTVLPRAEYIKTLLPLLSVTVNTSLRIAAPIVFALLLANFALGLLARVAPQLQLFILSMGLTIMVGMMVLKVSISSSLSLVIQAIRLFPDYLQGMIGG